VPHKDPEDKAVAGYGLYVPAVNDMLLCFVQGRPVRAVTCVFLACLVLSFAAQGKQVLFLIWDNTSGHISQAVRS
jgi:hypothetical protein